MEPFSQPHPDLASILQTLSAYAPAPPDLQPQPTAPQPIPPDNDELEEGEYDPSDYDPTLPFLTNSAGAEAQYPAVPPQQPTIQPRATPPAKPRTPSPASITSYPAALRHITAHILPDPQKSHRIRRLIQTQHEHERQWWSARRDLLRRISSREEGRKKIDDVLASVGGLVTAEKRPVQDGEMEAEQELRLFERKVWKAQGDMVRDAERELAGVGVPFFGECAVEEEEELAVLRGKVLGLLEDLFAGEEGG